MASENITQETLSARFSDISVELRTMLIPIKGYEKVPLVSLEEAIVPVVLLVRDVRRRANIMKQRCKNPANNLSPDEAASIMLYTAEWEPSTDSLYFILNSTLRKEDRTKLSSWFLYLKLLLTALTHLPPIGERTVYRGIRQNMSHLYPQGKTLIWWAFSSCTENIDTLETATIFGKKGARTLFTIKCYSGKDIHQYSTVENESEVLLLPGIQLEVVASLDQGPNFHIIQLKEVEPLHPFLEPLPGHRIPLVMPPASEP
ncbi:unnamed protein product [Rotaria sp. Silwood2]